MKKYYFLFGVLGLIVGYFSKYDFWFEDSRDVFFPISKAQLKLKKTHATNAQSLTKTNVAPIENIQPINSVKIVDLDKLSQAELFHELYNKKVLNTARTQGIYFEKIKNRLNSKYPEIITSEHKTAYEKEVSNRLGLLRAMTHFWRTPKEVNLNEMEIKKFFQDVAKNNDENIMVRRQAYKNWLSFGSSVSQLDKNQILASTENRLLHLISLSDENLIQSLTESAE